MRELRGVARVVATALQVHEGRLLATLVFTEDSVSTFTVEETAADAVWVAGVLEACGVAAWEELRGRTVYVLRDRASGPDVVTGLEHLATEPGGRFDFPAVVAGRRRGGKP